MHRFLKATGLALIAAFSLSCSVNILQSFGDETSDDALYDAARILNDARDYDGALTKLTLVSSSYATKEKVILLKAKAYAGKCGLDFLQLVDNIDSIGTKNFFIFLMNEFRAGTVTKAGYCLQAEDLIESIGATPAARTDDQNVFIAMLSFAKIGNWLSYYADANDDLTVDSIDFCATPVDADVREIGSAINIALQSLSAAGVNVGNAKTALITAACPALGAQDFCSVPVYDPTAFNANQIKGIRSMVRSGPATNSVGIYSCNTGADLNGCGVALCP